MCEDFAARARSSELACALGSNCLKPNLLGEKICNQLDGALWILLHDPVPGVGHDAARDVAGGELHMIGHVLTEKLLGTDGKHRHGDLTALGEQRLVVSGVLAECPKLLEGIVHRMRPCVHGSKVLPRVFIDPLGVCGQLVPEAIEVYALPALYETLLVRTSEIEVPQRRAANDGVPIADPGQRCIDHHP